jgi:hypothetical protein
MDSDDLAIDLGSAGLGEILQELTRVLQERNWPPVLRSGLSSSSINAMQKRFGVTFASDIVALYQFCDGWESAPGLLPEFSLLPLSSAIQESRQQRYRWLTLLTNGGGDYLYVSAKSQNGPIKVHRVLDQIHDVAIYDSVRSFFATALVAYVHGVFSVAERSLMMLGDDHQYRTIVFPSTVVKDYREWASIYRKLNPRSAGKDGSPV